MRQSLDFFYDFAATHPMFLFTVISSIFASVGLTIRNASSKEVRQAQKEKKSRRWWPAAREVLGTKSPFRASRLTGEVRRKFR